MGGSHLRAHIVEDVAHLRERRPSLEAKRRLHVGASVIACALHGLRSVEEAGVGVGAA